MHASFRHKREISLFVFFFSRFYGILLNQRISDRRSYEQ